MGGEVNSIWEVLENVSEDEESADACKNAFQKLLRFLRDFPDDFKDNISISRLLVVCAGHCGSHYWTSTSNRQLVQELLIALCVICEYSDTNELLNRKPGLLETILAQLKTALTKENWKNSPVFKQGLIWVIKHVKHPNLAPHLGSILPPTLWMLDDSLDYNRIQALFIITHIIQQVDPTELQWHGRARLFYEAMKPFFYVSNSEVICALHSCLLNLLPVLDYSSQPLSIPAKSKMADEVFGILITGLAKESKVSLQRAYVAQMKGYMQLLGIFTTRHVKELLPLLLRGLEHSDPKNELLRKLSLQSLSTLICYTWPCASTYKLTVVASLSKLVMEDPIVANNQDLLDLVVECLEVLLAACPELEDKYKWMAKFCNHGNMQSCLQKALKETSIL